MDYPVESIFVLQGATYDQSLPISVKAVPVDIRDGKFFLSGTGPPANLVMLYLNDSKQSDPLVIAHAVLRKLNMGVEGASGSDPLLTNGILQHFRQLWSCLVVARK